MSCSDITVEILGDAADIRVYVKQAQDAATFAQTEATRADTLAQQASVSATQAAASATAAAASEASATGSATVALSYQNEARKDATAAQGYSLDAQNSATQAEDAATRAEAAATKPYQIQISDDGTPVGLSLAELNFTGQGVAVTSPSTGKYNVNITGTPTAQPPTIADVQGLQAALDGKEAALGTPANDYMVLASKKDGSRHWIAQSPSGGVGVIRMGSTSAVQHPIDDVEIGKGLTFTYQGMVATVVAEISKTDLDVVTARIDGLFAKTSTEWQTAFNGAISQYVSRLTAAEGSLQHNALEIASLHQDMTAAQNELQQLKNGKVDTVESKVNPASKTITLTFKSGQDVIDTDLIDISAMFATNPPAQQQTIWFGFGTVKPPAEAQIKAGTSEQDHVIIGHDITLTRAVGTPAYMYVWIPDAMGAISGFSFSHAFVDVWQSWPVTVDGVAGKVYVSDNQTNATTVSFEVQ